MSPENKLNNLCLEIVNIIASGELNIELDLSQIANDINAHNVDHYENKGSVFIKITEETGLTILYRTGKYIIRGGNSFEKLTQTNEQFIRELRELGIICESYTPSLTINNLVFVGDIGHTVELEVLFVELGFQNAEFEPEQFPGIIYRPEDYNCVLLVFGTGKVVVTGSYNENEAIDAFHYLKQKCNKIYD